MRGLKNTMFKGISEPRLKHRLQKHGSPVHGKERVAGSGCLRKSQSHNPQRALRSKKINPDRKFQSRLEIFNPGRKFQSRSKFQSPSFHLRGPRSVQRRARSKISIHDRSLEIFNPEGRDRIFSIPGPSGSQRHRNIWRSLGHSIEESP